MFLLLVVAYHRFCINQLLGQMQFEKFSYEISLWIFFRQIQAIIRLNLVIWWKSLFLCSPFKDPTLWSIPGSFTPDILPFKADLDRELFNVEILPLLRPSRIPDMNSYLLPTSVILLAKQLFSFIKLIFWSRDNLGPAPI